MHVGVSVTASAVSRQRTCLSTAVTVFKTRAYQDTPGCLETSPAARAMACVETGRLITAPCVARREVRNRRRTEIQLNNPPAAHRPVGSTPREDGCCCVRSTNRRRCTRCEDIRSNCLLRRASARARGSASVARALPFSMHPVRAVCVRGAVRPRAAGMIERR